ncbi:MAG TPA: GNAT family N-acetyltransferase [Pseudonocardia sp.]|nr:GNAT family N-acetyltransferase [Pseudonocardia sp.]
MGLWRVHVEVEDRPGRLGELAAAVGAAGCNIVSLTVLGERGPDGAVTDELLVDAADQRAATALVDRIRGAGMGATLAVPAGAGELRDPVTTALALARRVASDPTAAPRAVASLLHARLLADDVASDKAVTGEPTGHTHRLCVGGREVLLNRAWAFTATELSRAAVLVELAALCASPDAVPAGSARPPSEPVSLGLVLLGNGSEVELRVASRSDGPLVAALHARCTPSTRRGRFLNPSPTLPPTELTELLAGRSGTGSALLALTTDGGHAVGLATLDPDGGGRAALGVLVEDTWQARGVGTALVRRAVELATEAGHLELSAVAHPGNLRITRLLRRSGLRPTAQLVDGLLRVQVTLRQPVTAAP